MTVVGWVAIAALALTLVVVTVAWLQARRRAGGLGSAAVDLAGQAERLAKDKAAADDSQAAEDARATVQDAQDKAKEAPRESLADRMRRMGAGR